MRLRDGIAPLIVFLGLLLIAALALPSLREDFECITNQERAYFSDKNGTYEFYRNKCEGNTWKWAGGYWGELDPPPTPDLAASGEWLRFNWPESESSPAPDLAQ